MTQDVVKRFGTTAVLDHAVFALHQGEILGLLELSGAGKTTATRAGEPAAGRQGDSTSCGAWPKYMSSHTAVSWA